MFDSRLKSESTQYSRKDLCSQYWGNKPEAGLEGRVKGQELRIMISWGQREGRAEGGTFYLVHSPGVQGSPCCEPGYGQVQAEGRAGRLSWFSFQRFSHHHDQFLKLATG